MTVVATMLALAAAAAPLPPGTKYVAMGSSFAAGPGIQGPSPSEGGRCARSSANYAHLIAARLSLALTDVSCSGATTDHLLGPWKELPPQIDAVTADTRLVTVTIGGNDVGYIGRLGTASCRAIRPQSACPTADGSPQDWRRLADQLTAIVAAIRMRAPAARIVLIDYLTLLPTRGACALIPLAAPDAALARATAKGIDKAIAGVARRTGTLRLAASTLSADHHACAPQPWVSGLIDQSGAIVPVPLHPNALGMTAVADALLDLLLPRRKRKP